MHYVVLQGVDNYYVNHIIAQARVRGKFPY